MMVDDSLLHSEKLSQQYLIDSWQKMNGAVVSGIRKNYLQ